MQEMLRKGPVTDINALITACEFSDDAYVLLERFPEQLIADNKRADLLRFRLLGKPTDRDDHNVLTSISGRVFQSDRELRWEKVDGSYHAVYLGAELDLPILDHDESDDCLLNNLIKHERAKHYYLFGEILDTKQLRNMDLKDTEDMSVYYAEVRIPRILRYPQLTDYDTQKSKRRVQLVICEYVHQDTGSLQLFRFQDLVSEE